jgi:UPF0755 protein
LLRLATSTVKIALIGITALAVLAGGIWFFNWYQDRTASANVGTPIVITIGEDDSVGDVADTLAKYDLINIKPYFEGLIRFQNKDLKPGTYRLTIGMSTSEIVKAITTEKSTAATENKTLKVTIPEGYRIGQIADAVEEAGLNGGRQAFLDALANFDYSDYSFADEVPTTGDKAERLEGFLFPDTYEFKSADPPEYLIQNMLNNFEDKFTQEMRDQAEAMGLSIREVITLASIVEREAAVSNERPTIAQVYLNRVDYPMQLGADPTVQYALGKEGNWWPELGPNDTSSTDSPYNTYLNMGLPPGPICNPGLDSILGVLNPDGSSYLFFVAKDDGSGEHAFAETQAEQDANIERYQNSQLGG